MSAKMSRTEMNSRGGFSLAIIPARCGSEGLADKNILDLCGKPVMSYTIEAALDSGCFDKVVVSTDSVLYGDIAARYGAEVVFRSDKLSTSGATTYMVLKDYFSNMGELPSVFALLQPTSPLRKAWQIAEAFELHSNNNDLFNFVVSVEESDHASALVKPLDENGSLSFFDADFKSYKRQNYKEYTPNGAIFIAKPREYLQQGHFFGKSSLGYIMDKRSSVDIDDCIDFALAECLIAKEKEIGFL